MPKRFQVTITEEAFADLSEVRDKSVQKSIQTKIGELTTEPHKRGKPLTDDLAGYYRLKARGRYRIIYEVAMLEELVIIVVVGIRKEGDKRDAYKVAKKRLL